MAAETILLTRQESNSQVDIAAVIPAIEHAMGQFEKGQDYLPPKAIYHLPVADGVAACITGYTQSADVLSMKVGQERTANPDLGLPTTNSWVAVFNPETGELIMICDGTLPTMYRTAAAAAVSAKHLARADVRALGVIGAGQLGRQCVRAVSLVREFDKIYLYDVAESIARQAADELAAQVRQPIEIADAETVCRRADVLVTATNSREPIVRAAWVADGTHLCCMGTDLHEKIECEMTLLLRCRIFADVTEHALVRGEVSQAVEQGVLGSDCYAGTLGQVINGSIDGRTDPAQVTMFDGVGIGIQDTTVARAIYDQAVAKGIGTRFAFS